jgi:DNA repair protein RadC
MKITSPRSAHDFFKQFLTADIEEFWAAALNSEKEPVAARCLFRGTVDHCLFHPRDVFRFACRHNASALIVAHNHPSGNAQPSPQDLRITRQLVRASSLLEVPVVDHLILAGGGYYSFLESASAVWRRSGRRSGRC